MDIDQTLFHDLVYTDKYKSLQSFLDRIDLLITPEIGSAHSDFRDLFDTDFIKELREFNQPQTSLHFGKTMRDIKCIISDENFKEHVIWIQHIGPKNFRISNMDLPQSHIQDQTYRTIEDVVNSCQKHVAELSNYFDELVRIDSCCTVMEPVRPTFKEDYRKIQLADKIWLHVEVSPDGSAKNLNVIGQFDQQELQELLQAWDHDKDIATNILKITASLNSEACLEINKTATVPDCGICYCVELPGYAKVPQPLCNNSKCGTYFHRSCLYEWLVACAGGRTPQFGVGICPCCSQYIQCSDRDI